MKAFRLGLMAVGLTAVLLLVLGHVGLAQKSGAGATLSGSVVAPAGVDVRAFRVLAKDTAHRITYGVYTVRGRYQIFNLPPGAYEVKVLEENVDSPTETVTLAAGDAKAVNVTVTTKALPPGPELRDYDALYPPGPERDLLELKCFGCHQIQQQWHLKGGKTEAAWRSAIEHMWDRDMYNKRRLIPWIKNPPIMEYPLTPQETTALAKYFFTHFPPGHKRVDFKKDELVRDEAALGQALWVQYELAPLPTGPQGAEFSDPQNQKPSRATHDPFPSTAQPGVVWLAGLGNGSFIAVDTKNPDFATRMKEWRIPHPENINVGSHGIIELNGKAYTVGVGDDALNEFDPKTGQFNRYAAPLRGAGAHTLRADSKGNIWFTTVYGGARVHLWDAKTKKVTEYNPVKGANWYGVDVDKKDRVFVASYTTYNVAMFDPKTSKWTIFPTSGAHRRLGVDEHGKVWAGQYFGNKLEMIDPDTGKVTEYTLPLKYGNLYEAWPDGRGHVWSDVTRYNSLVGFDQTRKTFTYFPYPIFNGHAPKVEVDKQGTIWFGLGQTLTGFKPKGNVPGSAGN